MSPRSLIYAFRVASTASATILACRGYRAGTAAILPETTHAAHLEGDARGVVIYTRISDHQISSADLCAVASAEATPEHTDHRGPLIISPFLGSADALLSL